MTIDELPIKEQTRLRDKLFARYWEKYKAKAREEYDAFVKTPSNRIK